MGNVWAFVKKHPYATGAAALVLFLGILLLMGGGNEESQTVMNSGPSDAQVAANAQLMALQTQAGLQSAQTAAEKEVALAGIASQNKAYELSANLQMQNLNIQHDLERRAQEIGHDTSNKTIEQNQIALPMQYSLLQQRSTFDYMLGAGALSNQRKAISGQNNSSMLGSIGSILGAFF